MSEESLLTFPCEFPIKVMGRASENFEADGSAKVNAELER